jgi:DNA-binding transcriptional MerR regulator
VVRKKIDKITRINMPTDTEKRIKELLETLKKDGANLIVSDGKPLSQFVKELEQQIENLKKDISDLKKNSGGNTITIEEFERRLGGKQNFDDKGVFKGTSSTPNQQPSDDKKPDQPQPLPGEKV